MSINVVYVISDISNALTFEWIRRHFVNSEFNVSFVLIGNKGTALSKTLLEGKASVFQIPYSSKIGLLAVLVRLFFILWKEKPQVVHTHLFIANIFGLTSSWLLRVRTRVYTRHHALTHYMEHPQGLKWDKLCNALATDIIAISRNVEDILIYRDRAKRSKIHLVHHGFDLSYFQNVEAWRVEALRIKYGLRPGANWPVVGAISRYVSWKGLQYLIPAFGKVREKYPQAHLILANAQGDFSNQISALLGSLPPGSFTEITFENDLAALYKLFDVFIHTPTDPHVEAFGQTYIEALAAGVPSVFTKSGVASEFLSHEKNALIVEYKSVDAIAAAVLCILSDAGLKDALIKNGMACVSSFDLEPMLNKLESLYRR